MEGIKRQQPGRGRERRVGRQIIKSATKGWSSPVQEPYWGRAWLESEKNLYRSMRAGIEGGGEKEVF